jgi:hypothetical protein
MCDRGREPIWSCLSDHLIRRVAQYRPNDRWLLHGREAAPTLEESLGFKVANIGLLKKASPLGSCFTAGLS